MYVEGDIKLIIHRQKRRQVPLYKKADWEGLRQHMASFTESFLASDNSDLTADGLWCKFCVELNAATKKFIPHKLTKSRNGLPYLTKDLKRLMRKRDKLHARKDPRYKVLKHAVQKKPRCAYYQYVEDIISPSNNDNHLETNERFCGLLKHAKADSAEVHPPKKTNGALISEPKEKASLLNSYFQSVFTGETPLPLKHQYLKRTGGEQLPLPRYARNNHYPCRNCQTS